MSRARRFVSGAASLLGLAFVFAGGVKIRDPAAAAELFRNWGLDTSVIVPAGWVEAVLGLLLFHGPTRRAGAAAMAGWMLLFGILQGRAGQAGAAAASAGVFLLSLATVTLHRVPPQPAARRIPAPLRDPPATVRAGVGRLAALVGVSFLIRFAVGGVLFWCALPVLGWAHARRSDGAEASLPHAVLLYLLVLGLGVSGLWSFVGHAFLADTVAGSVGWAASPFQTELAFYHLGVGIAGLGCWWIRDRFWLATALIPSVFLYGAGLVHLRSFLETGNAAPANWGWSVLVGNVAVPTVLLALAVPTGRGARGAGARSAGRRQAG